MSEKIRAGRSLFDSLCDFLTACGSVDGERARKAVDAVGETLAPGVDDIGGGDVVGGIAKIVLAHKKKNPPPLSRPKKADHDGMPEKSSDGGPVKPF